MPSTQNQTSFLQWIKPIETIHPRFWFSKRLKAPIVGSITGGPFQHGEFIDSIDFINMGGRIYGNVADGATSLKYSNIPGLTSLSLGGSSTIVGRTSGARCLLGTTHTVEELSLSTLVGRTKNPSWSQFWSPFVSYCNGRANATNYPNSYFTGSTTASSKEAEYAIALAFSYVMDNTKTAHAARAVQIADYTRTLAFTTGQNHSQRQRTLVMAVVYDWLYDYMGLTTANTTIRSNLRTRVISDVTAMYQVADAEYMWGTDHGDMEYATIALLCVMEDDPSITVNNTMVSIMDTMMNYRDNGTGNNIGFFPVFRHFGNVDGGSHKGSGEFGYFERNEEFNLRVFPAVKSALQADWHASEPWYALGGHWKLWHWRGDRTFHAQGEHQRQNNYAQQTQGHLLQIADRDATSYGDACMWLVNEMYSKANAAIWGPYQMYNILWRGTARTSTSLPAKPTTSSQMRFFDKAGKICLREGWDTTGLSITISIPRYFTGGHSSRDAGCIQLATDEESMLLEHGHYDPNQTITYLDTSGTFNVTGHRYTYMNRILGKNCVSIYDSSEATLNPSDSFQETLNANSRFGSRFDAVGSVAIDNDGGQLWPKNVDGTAFEPANLAAMLAEGKWNFDSFPTQPQETSTYCYIVANLKPFYWANKCTRYKRHYLYVKVGSIQAWDRPILLIWDDLITTVDVTQGNKTQRIFWQTNNAPDAGSIANNLSYSKSTGGGAGARLWIKTMNPPVNMTTVFGTGTDVGQTGFKNLFGQSYLTTAVHGTTSFKGGYDDSLDGVYRTEIYQATQSGIVSFLSILFPSSALHVNPEPLLTLTLINDVNYFGVLINQVECKMAKGDTHSALVMMLDTIAPAIPTGLRLVKLSYNQVDIAWDANTEADLESYRVWRALDIGGICGVFSLQFNPIVPSYSDTTVSPSTAYCYKVQAKDTTGNVSDFSPVLTVMTPAAPPVPTISPSVQWQTKLGFIKSRVHY